jgi:hypothetical protein
MGIEVAWAGLEEAVRFAVSRIVDDPDPLNEREAADGHLYVLRMLTAVGQSNLLTFDPRAPRFLPMLDSVRYLGASGPDIDYDVAMVLPGVRYRVSGQRGAATFVGIAVYGDSGERGASGILARQDVDDLVDGEGRFVYEFSHPQAARVIVRQYFHDRATQARGSWSIEPVPPPPADGEVEAAPLPTVPEIEGRVVGATQSLRWNAQLNDLWSPERRAVPNQFVRQTPDDIVAAITNPDVVYSFAWWRVGQDEALVIEFTPPQTRYWGLQVCDRWFQAYPDRRTNLNDHAVVTESDGSVRLVLADGDPGHPNWLDTSGHRVGTMFFRWLHADPQVLPTCRIIPAAEVAGLCPRTD